MSGYSMAHKSIEKINSKVNFPFRKKTGVKSKTALAQHIDKAAI